MYGRDFFGSLVPGLPFTSLVMFQIQGRRPTDHRRRWLEMILAMVSNPGLRDEAVRTGINVALAKGPPLNGLLAGLLARTGSGRGGIWIERVMGNLIRARETHASLAGFAPDNGLGMHFGSPDQRAVRLLPVLRRRRFLGPHTRLLIAAATGEHPILLEGLAAAGFADLGLTPVQGAALFVMAAFPALLAFTLEQREQGLKEYPTFYEPGAFSYTGPQPSPTPSR